jgi:hypothetical protein
LVCIGCFDLQLHDIPSVSVALLGVKCLLIDAIYTRMLRDSVFTLQARHKKQCFFLTDPTMTGYMAVV